MVEDEAMLKKFDQRKDKITKVMVQPPEKPLSSNRPKRDNLNIREGVSLKEEEKDMDGNVIKSHLGGQPFPHE